MKSAEEIMNMLDAFDLTGSLRDAGELAGVSHHTVARYVAARDSGVADRGVTRPMLIDEFLAKVEEWIERSNGKLRADVAHDNLVALGFTGSERTTRRAVAVVKKSYCLGRVFVCYDPLPGQNFTGGSRLSLVGSGARGQCQEEYRRQQKRIAAVDIRAPMHEERRQVCAYLH